MACGRMIYAKMPDAAFKAVSGILHISAPCGARFLRVQVPNPPGSGKDIAEGKGVHREVECPRGQTL